MPTSAFNKFNSFVEAVTEGVHNFETDQLVLALCAAANAPVAGNTQLSDLTQISYTNLSSRNIITSSSGQASGLYKLILTNLTLAASGGSVAAFRYAVIFNDDATNDELVGWYDYGSDLVLADGESLNVNFDAANGAINLT